MGQTIGVTPPLPQHHTIVTKPPRDTDPSHGRENTDHHPTPAWSRKHLSSSNPSSIFSAVKIRRHHGRGLAHHPLASSHVAVATQGPSGEKLARRAARTRTHAPTMTLPYASPCSGFWLKSRPRRHHLPKGVAFLKPHWRQQEAHCVPRPSQRIPVAAPGHHTWPRSAPAKAPAPRPPAPTSTLEEDRRAAPPRDCALPLPVLRRAPPHREPPATAPPSRRLSPVRRRPAGQTDLARRLCRPGTATTRRRRRPGIHGEEALGARVSPPEPPGGRGNG